MEPVVVIANPFAGTGRGRLSGADAVKLLRDRGLAAVLKPTKRPGHARGLARDASRFTDLVVAVGGDGTINEVAGGLVGTGCRLGVLPSGSGNDFAGGIGCGTVEAGLAAIEGGRELAIDVCALNGAPFINSVGLLASGLVSNRAAQLWRWLGRARYSLATLEILLKYRGQEVHWEFGGVPADEPLPDVLVGKGRWLLVEVCNGPTTGGGFRFVPDARLSDGLLDVCLIEPVGLAAAVKMLPGAVRGDVVRHEAISVVRCTAVTFTSRRRIAYHRDGEASILAAGCHKIEMLPGKLRVLVPSGFDGS